MEATHLCVGLDAIDFKYNANGTTCQNGKSLIYNSIDALFLVYSLPKFKDFLTCFE